MPERGGKKNRKTNLTQIYIKNMTLDSYEQLSTAGALFTEKKAIYSNIYNNKDCSHKDMRRLLQSLWEIISDDKRSLT